MTVQEARGTPLRAGRFVLTPIEQVDRHVTRARGGVWAFGTKRPVAIVVADEGREWRIEVPCEPSPVASDAPN